MPFISSEIFEKISISDHNLEWPKTHDIDSKIIKNFEHTSELVSKIRNFKKSTNIGFKDSIKLYYDNQILDAELKTVLQKLTNCESILLGNNEPLKMNSIMVGKHSYFIDSDKKLSTTDISKIQEDLDYNIGFKNILEKKLSNKKFVENAPKQVVENEKKKLDDVISKINSLEKKIKNITD
jgi:valyl-tRNA synthetase